VSSSPVAPHDPFRNPSYPQRTHFGEKQQLEETVRTWDETIAEAGRQLASLEPTSSRATLQRLYHQMLGARDQIAEAARRMPLETGDLYEDDRQRFQTGTAALERLRRQWDAVKF
jgi:hypothetical protein